MDQHRMIETILVKANINGTKDEHLPYPNSTQQPEPLSKLDCVQTDEEKIKYSRYPYRRVVGQLMYGMYASCTASMYYRAMETTQAIVTHTSSNTFSAMSSIAIRIDSSLTATPDRGHRDDDSSHAAALPVRCRLGWQHGQRPQPDQLSRIPRG
jgi:hypothetical protein